MIQTTEQELVEKEEKTKFYNTLKQQIEPEYQLCFKHFDPKRQTWLKRLKLYNNQKKNADKVSDPLLFTIFQTILPSLSTKYFSGVFEGKEDGDNERAENLNNLAEYDKDQMQYEQMEYEWSWDAGFFGVGYCLLDNFDREKMCPLGEILDPLLILKDPSCTTINGNAKGYGRARFWGREASLTMSEMENHGDYINLDQLKETNPAINTRSQTSEADEARDEAQGRQTVKLDESGLTENKEYELLEWYTHKDGKKVLVTLAQNRSVVVRYRELKDAEWPIVERRLFPIPHDPDATSIPDLIEDKQRARAILINLGLDSAKADLYPMYLYDKRRIKNERSLDFDFNKFVPVNGSTDGAVTAIQKSSFHQQVQIILDILDLAAQKATAAPEVQQGVQPNVGRTLGETELVSSGANRRQSLAIDIFGWSEKELWRLYYKLYKIHFKDKIDKKIIRLEGTLGATWKTIVRGDIVGTLDPDIRVVNIIEREAKRQKDFVDFMAIAQIAMQDPDSNRRYIQRKLAQIKGIPKQQIDLMWPKTIDEIVAEDENDLIDNGNLPMVKAIDDDIVHIEIHNRAADFPEKLAHIEAHKIMMRKKKERPDLGVQNQSIMGQFNTIVSPQKQAMGGQISNQKPASPNPQMIEYGQ